MQVEKIILGQNVVLKLGEETARSVDEALAKQKWITPNNNSPSPPTKPSRSLVPTTAFLLKISISLQISATRVYGVLWRLLPGQPGLFSLEPHRTETIQLKWDWNSFAYSPSIFVPSALCWIIKFRLQNMRFASPITLLGRYVIILYSMGLTVAQL